MWRCDQNSHPDYYLEHESVHAHRNRADKHLLELLVARLVLRVANVGDFPLEVCSTHTRDQTRRAHETSPGRARTVLELLEALERNLELERVRVRGRVVQDNDVGQVDGAHRRTGETQQEGLGCLLS